MIRYLLYIFVLLLGTSAVSAEEISVENSCNILLVDYNSLSIRIEQAEQAKRIRDGIIALCLKLIDMQKNSDNQEDTDGTE